MALAGLSPSDLTDVWAELSILSVMFALRFGRYRQVWRMAWILVNPRPPVEVSPFPSGRGRSRQIVIAASLH